MNAPNDVPTFSQLTPAARVLWAKSGDTLGHGLLAHLLDVAAVVEIILEHEPESTRRWIANALGFEPEHCVKWVALLLGLHDFGKGIPGFQCKWESGQQQVLAAGLTFPAASLASARHDLATAALLPDLLDAGTRTELAWWRGIIQAISAHHGFHFLPTTIPSGRPMGEPGAWGAARREVFDVYWRVLAPTGSPRHTRLTLPVVNWLAGLTSTADWIASNTDWFPLNERRDDLQAYYADARRRAGLALQAIRWKPYRPLLAPEAGNATVDELLRKMTGLNDISARPLQLCGDRLLQGARGPSLLLVEAPMGEGKTELAFLAHLRLQALNDHRGLYLAPPTQATGNAMFHRTLTFLQGFVEGHADIQLIHGGAAMHEDVLRLRDIDGSRTESIAVSAWFAQRRRPLLSPYGVGTIDQALLSVLNVKHHFVRLWGLANRVVVLDEVHAYDTYTSGLIGALLRWLKALGSSVVLMSATLPTALRAELVRAWGVDSAELPELAYPRVIIADDDGVRGEQFAARPLAPIALLGLGETLEGLAEQALGLVAEGGCGALIVNTVDRAQKLYGLLQERLQGSIRVLLFHARYPADERAERETLILKHFGRNGARPERALVVATQVIEQSLDLDFDFMLSDLAPVDLLLQRAGRLHRHDRTRPASHAQARLWVAGLLPEKFPELKETAWGYVYDPYILARTWALLRRVSSLELPADIDHWVQKVYDTAPLPEDIEADIATRIETAFFGEHIAQTQFRRQQYLNIVIDATSTPAEAYVGKPEGHEEGEEGDAIGLKNQTRLGPDTITVIPVDVDGNEWATGQGEKFPPTQVVTDAIARHLYQRQIRISRAALVRHFQAVDATPAFREHPLLRNIYPLPLTDGVYVGVEGLCVRLDQHLGLVYEALTREG